MTKHSYSLLNIWIAGCFLKLLLIPAYHSTDFEVHRNWLAITHKLPISQWYFENTSQWTLDYPPFFAYFEYLLSQFVPQVVKNDNCLLISENPMYSFPTIIFQRLTVIFSEIFLFLMLQWSINTSKNKQAAFVACSSIALSPGFLMLDHVHFQYNGFLFGFIIGSIISIKLKRYLLSAVFFSTALCFKHIFLYFAPVYFVYLLRIYCLNLPINLSSLQLLTIINNNKFQPWKLINWPNLIKLGSTVLFIFFLAFGPFITQVPQLLTRLFPFSRGLTHAYWAPNVWAIYSFLDWFLIKLNTVYPFIDNIIINSNTKGLVQDVFFTILPNIPPKFTFLLTLFYQILTLIPLFLNPTYTRFLGSLTLCGLSSFLFGWHVHEKAIMLVIIPFTFLIIFNSRFYYSFFNLTISGFISFFPLLFNIELFPLKMLYTFVWSLIYLISFKEICPKTSNSRRIFFLDRLSITYLIGFLPLLFWLNNWDLLINSWAILKKFEFLRLMTLSVYCSLGIVGSWFGLSWLYFFDDLLWVS